MRSTAAHTRRLWRRTTWQRAALLACAVVVALIQLGGSDAASTATPDQVGQWSAPIAFPIVAVHMSLESTGQVWLSDAWDAAVNTQREWNPSSGTFTSVPYGRNLFCAGHVNLPDGRTLIVGGNVSGDVGLPDTTIFNPTNNSYFRGPDMSVGRWYPTATVLPDGRVLAFAGDNIVQDRPGQPHPFEDASVNSLPSIYNPKTNAWTDLTSAQLTSPLYPFMFVLSNGKVFDAGPDTVTRTFDPATATWSTVGTSPFDGMSAVMYRPDKIMKAGTWADPDFNGAKVYNSGAQTAVIDMSAPSPSWRSTAAMNFPRSYQNMTLLPDGTVLASGGMTDSDGTDLTKAVLPAEIWNPDTETWTTVASLTNGREYHSTALLLPDGRVLMAGGGGLPGRATDQLNGEIYSPPYLFKGARPTITAAPSSAAYGANFDVTTPNAASIAHVSLIRTASVTHAFDQNQRFQFLNFTVGSGKVTVTAPANTNLAPPGDYLLFLVDNNGVPSTGSFIRISSTGDVTPPTAPSNLTATPTPGQVALSWTASTDASGIASYSVYRSTTAGFTPSTSNRIAQPTGTSYTDVGVAAGTYYYKVTADDNAGNTSAASNEVSAVVPTGPPPGRVGAWGFDEGSGTTVADQSGNNNNGTLTNATWAAAGKFGKALSFNGSSAFVSIPDSNSLDLTTGLTVEGWVNPSTSGGGVFRTLLVKERPGDLVYGLYANSDTNRPQSQVTVGSTAKLLDGTAAVPTGTWTHLAFTFDGTTERLYVNGTQVSSVAISGSILTSSSPVKIGGNAIWGEYFNGLIDEVRLYNRALSASEITTDMNTPISSSDSTPPSAPGTLTATGGLGQVSLTWGAATDNVGVTKYDVYRSTTSGFTPSSANRIAQPTGTTYTDSGLAAGTYYYKVTAEDAAGNVGPAGNEASGAATADTTPPTAPSSLAAVGGAGQIALSWQASTDAGGIARYSVYRATTSGFTPSTANRIAQPTGTSYTDTGLAAGTYYYKVTADDNAGNTSSPSNEASGTATAAPPTGIVAAYSFDAGSGTTAADSSGNGNTGTLTNAAWAGAGNGKFGNAVSFNGTNASVSVPDSNSLDLTGGMTIEGWVKPNTVTGFHTVLVKETSGNLVYGLYAGSDTNKPQSQVTVGSPKLLDAPSAIPTGSWSHLAATFDGTTERLYVNGSQVASVAVSGTISTSTGALKIGGNAIWGEWFDGLIDEVRVYNRALSATEITTDMNSSISSPDTTPPSTPGTLTATGGLGQVSLSWGASSDNVGVTKYDVYRSTVAGFLPSASNRIAQPTGTTYVDTGLAAGTYFYKVTAEDAAGNLSSPSNEASGTATSDTSPPTAPGSLAASVAGSTVNLTWTAATDNVGVAKYDVYRSTTSGFTPSAANRIAQPTGTSYSDPGLTTGTYYYKVAAEDAAGNVGPASNEASANIGDTSPPTAPGSLTANVSGTSVALSWTASTDNIGVVRYNVHRGTTSGFTPSAANRIAQPAGLSYTDTSVPPGTYYYKVTGEDAAGNISPVSNTATATIPDTSPPTTPGNFTATGGAGQAQLSWSASTDNVGVVRYNVYRSTVAGFIPSTSNRIAQPTTTSYTDVVAAGTYFYKVTAEDAAGNLSSPSTEASATVTQGSTGLVAAYGFDAGSGTTATDQSGGGNNGTLTNATWAGSGNGKFGNALSFNGTSAYVSVPDSSSLDLTSGMTLEAWVKPNSVSGFRTTTFKETSGNLVYGLYAGSDTNKPQAQVSVGSPRLLDSPSAIPTGSWSHLAATYDGTTERLYVNGSQVASLAVSGTISTSTGALKIGGNAIWGEYFDGLIDEVRVYNRALSAGEITTDMNTSITSPDSVPPSAPGTLTATGGLGQISLSWGAATDNVGVTKYDVYRSTSSGFTPSVSNRIAQPTGLSYTDSGLASGTYYYKVTAEDAAGNLGPAGNEANAVASADTTPPSVSITAPSAGATVSGSVNVTANASDNGTVAGVQFKLDGSNLGAEDTTAPYSVSWDTFSSGNGSHTLSAVARDAAGNTASAGNVSVTVQNTAAAGLVGAWAFDEGSGTTVADQSGKGNTGTVSNTTWVTTGKFNNALSFNGTNAWVTVNDSNTLDLTTGMTVEAWLKPSTSGSTNWQTAVVKEQPGNLAYGMYANTNLSKPEAEVYVGGATHSVNGTSALPAGTWSHLAATYDGSSLKLYVNGSLVSQVAASGSIITSTNPLRIGGNNIWGERFTGLIDEVRVYNRALTAGEIQNDMVRSITPDTTAPTITSKSPTSGAAGVNVGSSTTATFSELMNSGSFAGGNFQLKDSSGNVVPASVSFDSSTNTATLAPQSALQYGATYTATIKGGPGGVTDIAGNPLASDVTWSFTTESSPPQILVVGSTTNPFGLYLGEILRNEGVDAFTTIDVGFLSPALLSGFDVVLLGDTALTPAQVSSLTAWVNGGGNLIAMKPDKQLAGLLGLTDAGSTRANAYLKVDTSTPPGAGIVSSTIQYHGTADNYSLSGATAVATLYSNASTATTNPAVTLRSVGSSGGQAAAFTYDLARSVVLTRQGNPAWAGQERDGVSGIRPDDMFYGAKSGDVQPDWLDTSKIAIPQADEQQRLLVNLMTLMERDKMPLPHFWYLPRGKKAAVVLSGDDHSPSQATGGTASIFDRFIQQSPSGCVVANWECIRATSYIYPDSVLTSAQANSYTAQGFEVALHPNVGSCPTSVQDEPTLSAQFDTQLAQWRAKYGGIPSPVSNRIHCVFWPGWLSSADVELSHGMRMDGNYYHYPQAWIGSRPGFLNGGGFPMRFADTNGNMIDVYEENTNMDDEAGQVYPSTVDALLDNAIGANGYYGAFGTNIHNDNPAPNANDDAIVASAQSRGIPLISYKQLLDWTDGRNSSTIRSMSWSSGTFSFTTTVGGGANGLQTLLPTQGPSGTLSALTCGGSAKAYSLQTIKGIQYAMFDTVTGSCTATYS